ncbi:hypothetical protein V498_09977 [Pseudogymnoascus sp. VKM F-4517 (FW-2822)]|nr:hypothetical protein V498_09977 [Pseudogymnoascus sp. VKM F-4517 (FW-2822)]
MRAVGFGSASRAPEPRAGGHPAHLAAVPVFLASAHDCGKGRRDEHGESAGVWTAAGAREAEGRDARADVWDWACGVYEVV